MRLKLILGIILCLGGIGLFVLSDYISNEVSEGRVEIQQGQKQVDGINSFFKNTTKTDLVGDVVTNSAQKKINKGIREANYYEGVSGQLKIAAWVSFIAGVIFLVFARRKRVR